MHIENRKTVQFWISAMNSELHRFFLKETQKHHIRNGSKKDGDEGLVFPFVGDKNDRCCEQFRYCGRDTAGGNIFHTVNDQYRHDGRRQCLAESFEWCGHFTARNGSARSPKVIRAETATAVIKYEVVMRGSPFSGTEVKGRIQSAAPGAWSGFHRRSAGRSHRYQDRWAPACASLLFPIGQWR